MGTTFQNDTLSESNNVIVAQFQAYGDTDQTVVKVLDLSALTFPTNQQAGEAGAVSVQGIQNVDVNQDKTAATATGLTNDATVYAATVAVDGGSAQTIAVTGSAAQTYATLITELDADTTGANWVLVGGDLDCISDTYGTSSAIAIVDDDLFSTLTDFAAVDAAVAGSGDGANDSLTLMEITWSIQGWAYVQLLWDANVDDEIITMSGDGALNYRGVGGNHNPFTDIPVGDVLLTSQGAGTDSSYNIMAVFKKRQG